MTSATATGPGTSVDITYKDRGDGYVDVDDMKLPWRTDATLDGIAKVASVIATNGPDDVGELACRITSNGRTLVEERGSGAYKVISCIATVDD